MPKPGYSTPTLPDWMMEGLNQLKKPGEDTVDVIRNLLYKNLGKPECAKLYEEWRKKHYPQGGQKPLG